MLQAAQYILAYFTNPARLRHKPVEPTLLSVPITGNCNSRCVMCDVWKTRSTQEITPDQLRSVLRGRLFRKIRYAGISGGEPTLRKDLPECVAAIVDSLKHLQLLSVTTHGFQHRRWADFLPELKQICERRGVKFRLNCSLDGVGQVHDEIRGMKGAFGRTTTTYQLAMERGIETQFQATISRGNVYHVNALLDHTETVDTDLIFRKATEIERLDNQDSISDVELDPSESSFFADFLVSSRLLRFATNPARRLFYRDLSKRLRTGADRAAPCYFQNEGVVLDEHGDLYHCSISTEPIGNAITEDAFDLYFSERSRRIRERLISRTCPGCVHDQSGAWSPWQLMKEVLRMKPIGAVVDRGIRGTRFAFGWTRAEAVQARLPAMAPKAIDGRRLHAIVIGAYGGEHVGDAAILGGVVQRLNQRCHLDRVTVLSVRPDRTRHWIRGLELPVEIDVVLNSERLAREALAGGDTDRLLVWAGGPVMDLPRVLLANLRMVQLAAANKVPFMLEGIGVGPLYSYPARRLSREIFDRAQEISVRSRSDADHPLMKGRSVRVECDPAFDYLASRQQPTKLRAIERQVIDRTLPSERASLTVGINLRPLWHRYFNCSAREAKSRYDRFLGEMASAFRTISRSHSSHDPTFVCFAMNADQFGFSDFNAAEDLRRRLDREIDFRVVECELGVDAAIDLIDRFNILIAMRFHAAIFGLSRDCRTLGIDYQIGGRGKVARLLEDSDRAEDLTSIDAMRAPWLTSRIDGVAAELPAPSRVGLPVLGSHS